MPNRRWTTLFLVAAFLIPAAAGCERSAATGGAARLEVLVYTAIEADQLPPLLESFRREHPDIELKVVRDSTGVITARLLAEAGDPRADVVWGLAATSLLVADQKGLLLPYTPEGLRHVSARFRDDRTPPHWVGTSVWMTAFAANTVELKRLGAPVPTSFEDIAAPVFRGQVTLPNPASSGTGFLTVCGILQSLGEERGWHYLDRLHGNVAQYTHSGTKPATLAAAGEFAVGVSMDTRVLAEKARGAPLEVVFPVEKSGWDLEATALVAKKDVKSAAKTFMDWAIGRSAFEQYSRNFSIVSHDQFRTPPPGYPLDPVGQLAKSDLAWAAANRDRILAEWTKRYGGKSESK